MECDDEPGPGRLLDKWISRSALAAELGVSSDTLARWQTQRIGPPCVRIGRKVIYRREAVRHWLISREPDPHRASARGRW